VSFVFLVRASERFGTHTPLYDVYLVSCAFRRKSLLLDSSKDDADFGMEIHRDLVSPSIISTSLILNYICLPSDRPDILDTSRSRRLKHCVYSPLFMVEVSERNVGVGFGGEGCSLSSI